MAVGGDAPDVSERHAGPCHEDEADGHQGLPEDPEFLAGGDGVEGGCDPALDRVFDRHHGRIGGAVRTLSSAVFTFEDGIRMASAASGTCIRAASVKVPSGPRNV